MFVTHDIDEALRLATVIAILDRGRLAQIGTPLEIVENPQSDFVRDFIGAQGIGLKLLSVRRGRRADAAGRKRGGRADCAADATLRDALSAMIARRVDRLPVADKDGKVGVITLADLVPLAPDAPPRPCPDERRPGRSTVMRPKMDPGLCRGGAKRMLAWLKTPALWVGLLFAFAACRHAGFAPAVRRDLPRRACRRFSIVPVLSNCFYRTLGPVVATSERRRRRSSAVSRWRSL